MQPQEVRDALLTDGDIEWDLGTGPTRTRPTEPPSWATSSGVWRLETSYVDDEGDPHSPVDTWVWSPDSVTATPGEDEIDRQVRREYDEDQDEVEHARHMASLIELETEALALGTMEVPEEGLPDSSDGEPSLSTPPSAIARYPAWASYMSYPLSLWPRAEPSEVGPNGHGRTSERTREPQPTSGRSQSLLPPHGPACSLDKMDPAGTKRKRHVDLGADEQRTTGTAASTTAWDPLAGENGLPRAGTAQHGGGAGCLEGGVPPPRPPSASCPPDCHPPSHARDARAEGVREDSTVGGP